MSMSVVYMIDGKPHRPCDCPQMEPTCQRDGHQRYGMTCGYATCMIPAPDVVTTVRAEGDAPEPIMHLSHDGEDTVSHKYWLSTDDRGREWYCRPLFERNDMNKERK